MRQILSQNQKLIKTPTEKADIKSKLKENNILSTKESKGPVSTKPGSKKYPEKDKTKESSSKTGKNQSQQ